MAAVGTSRLRVVTVCAVIVVAASAVFVVVRSAASHDPTRFTPYRWHSVSESASGEISTVDGIADPQHRIFWTHIHSSIGTATGGNLAMSNDRWFAQDQHGHWCADPLPANEVRDGNRGLDTPGIDPVHWLSTLADGATSPTINAAAFFDFVAQPVRARRTGSVIAVQFLSRPGGVRSQALSFSDFGNAPKITLPKTVKPCPPTAGH